MIFGRVCTVVGRMTSSAHWQGSHCLSGGLLFWLKQDPCFFTLVCRFQVFHQVRRVWQCFSLWSTTVKHQLWFGLCITHLFTACWEVRRRRTEENNIWHRGKHFCHYLYPEKDPTEVEFVLTAWIEVRRGHVLHLEQVFFLCCVFYGYIMRISVTVVH